MYRVWACQWVCQWEGTKVTVTIILLQALAIHEAKKQLGMIPQEEEEEEKEPKKKKQVKCKDKRKDKRKQRKKKEPTSDRAISEPESVST